MGGCTLPDIFVLRIPFSVFCLLIRLIYSTEMVQCSRVHFSEAYLVSLDDVGRFASVGRGSCSRRWQVRPARWKNK